MKVSFITNICPHYRVATYETLARYHDVTFLFFSSGDEWYWQQRHNVRSGGFNYRYLAGFRLGRTRITLTLPWYLWADDPDVYIKCVNGRFALPITYVIARIRRKPFVLWTGIWSRLHTPFHRLFFPVTRYIYRHADAIVVYGDHVRQYLMSEGVSSDRIFIAHHAVNNALYRRDVSAELDELRTRLDIAETDRVVLYLGRLEAVKGVSFLLEAFARLERSDLVLVIAGTGSEHSKLQHLAQNLGISERVRFPGYVRTDEAIYYYGLAWIQVLPSVTMPASKELWGLVVNEAFNQGVPVVATEAVGAAAGGLVRHGINGLIVPERSSASLAHALQQVLADSSLRDSMGQRAREDIAKWDNEQMVVGFRRAIEFVTNGLVV